MRRTSPILTTLLLAASGLLAAPAGAQIAPGGGPVAYGADNVEYLDSEGLLQLSGRAELIQAENRLRANTIDLHFESRGQGQAGGGGDVEEVVAMGDVYFVTPTQVIRGERAVYTAATDTIVVTGEVILTQGENVMTGSRLTVQVESGRATMDGAPTEAGRRVRGVFYPDES